MKKHFFLQFNPNNKHATCQCVFFVIGLGTYQYVLSRNYKLTEIFFIFVFCHTLLIDIFNKNTGTDF